MDDELKSTEAMDEFIRFVFEKVIEMYKDTVPDILAEVLKKDGKALTMDEVENITAEDVLKKFDLSLEHNISENPRIQWDDNYIDMIYLSNKANGIEEYTPHNNRLVIQTDNIDVYNAKSKENLMKLQENAIVPSGHTAVPISKLISDIDYVVHEMGHAFDRILRVNNPSYMYDAYMQNYMYKKEDLSMQGDIWDNEQLSIAMEKIILEKLQEKRNA